MNAIYRPRRIRQRHWAPGKQRHPKYWTPREIDYLLDHRGTMTDVELGAKLGRSEMAVFLKGKRLGVVRKSNFLTARQVEAILGVPDKKAAWLAAHGALRLTKSAVKQGPYRVWCCEIEEFERFLRRETHWYDASRIHEEPWRGMARDANRDPWLTVKQAAAIVGLTPGGLTRYITDWHLLPAITVPSSGKWGHEYRVRRSALAGFRARRPELVGHRGGRGNRRAA